MDHGSNTDPDFIPGMYLENGSSLSVGEQLCWIQQLQIFRALLNLWIHILCLHHRAPCICDSHEVCWIEMRNYMIAFHVWICIPSRPQSDFEAWDISSIINVTNFLFLAQFFLSIVLVLVRLFCEWHSSLTLELAGCACGFLRAGRFWSDVLSHELDGKQSDDHWAAQKRKSGTCRSFSPAWASSCLDSSLPIPFAIPRLILRPIKFFYFYFGRMSTALAFQKISVRFICLRICDQVPKSEVSILERRLLSDICRVADLVFGDAGAGL